MSSTVSSILVTGAGSGVGRECVLRFAAAGWQVALIGRRAEPLAETVALAGADASLRLAPFTCDLGDDAAVARTVTEVVARFGRLDAIINAAGTNIPQRALSELSLEDYHSTLAANLHGAFHLARAALPVMRRQGSGTFVNINSEAGLKASTKSGAAYAVSKFGLTGFTQTINAEERVHGIRACSIFPGDIDTPLLEKRPAPPPAEARTRMLRPEDVAACAWLAVTLPPRAVVEELLVRPL